MDAHENLPHTLCSKLHERLGVSLDAETVVACKSLGQLAKHVLRMAPTTVKERLTLPLTVRRADQARRLQHTKVHNGMVAARLAVLVELSEERALRRSKMEGASKSDGMLVELSAMHPPERVTLDVEECRSLCVRPCRPEKELLLAELKGKRGANWLCLASQLSESIVGWRIVLGTVGKQYRAYRVDGVAVRGVFSGIVESFNVTHRVTIDALLEGDAFVPTTGYRDVNEALLVPVNARSWHFPLTDGAYASLSELSSGAWCHLCVPPRRCLYGGIGAPVAYPACHHGSMFEPERKSAVMARLSWSASEAPDMAPIDEALYALEESVVATIDGDACYAIIEHINFHYGVCFYEGVQVATAAKMYALLLERIGDRASDNEVRCAQTIMEGDDTNESKKWQLLKFFPKGSVAVRGSSRPTYSVRVACGEDGEEDVIEVSETALSSFKCIRIDSDGGFDDEAANEFTFEEVHGDDASDDEDFESAHPELMPSEFKVAFEDAITAARTRRGGTAKKNATALTNRLSSARSEPEVLKKIKALVAGGKAIPLVVLAGAIDVSDESKRAEHEAISAFLKGVRAKALAKHH